VKLKPVLQLVLILYTLAWHRSAAQQPIPEPKISLARRSGENASLGRPPAVPRTLTADDGLSVIAAALDAHVRLRSKIDCSHLVHAIYDRAGLPYTYARSSDLYAGIDEFQRVATPQPGDLVVWLGHVGIVINPAQHVFFSAMRAGPEVDTYDAPYWKRRGQVRFYRYIKATADAMPRTRFSP
jgi:cell wall-associated NlpC family hydrolase